MAVEPPHQPARLRSATARQLAITGQLADPTCPPTSRER
jgi:hypothetical protein